MGTQMGNDIYDENKRLKRELEQLRAKIDEDEKKLPAVLERTVLRFLNGLNCIVVTRAGEGWQIRISDG